VPSSYPSLQLIPIFEDNYVFVLHNNQQAVVVDPGLAAPVLQFLQDQQLQLQAILITHHHHDHTGGMAEIKSKFPRASIYGPCSLSEADYGLEEGDCLDLLGQKFEVLEMPGHTLDHIAFYCSPWLFSGDVLFSTGCGRLFEGTAAQMLSSLAKIKALGQQNENLKICCTHEYTSTNLNWVQNKLGWHTEAVQEYAQEVASKRSTGQATVPLDFARELLINPFLRAQDPSIIKQLAQLNLLKTQDHTQANELEVFTTLRHLRNQN